MRRPFAVLMEILEDLSPDEMKMTLAQLGDALGEDTHRLMDALDANKVARGERGYIGIAETGKRPLKPYLDDWREAEAATRAIDEP